MLLANGTVLAPQALAELVPQLANSWFYPDGGALQLERQYAQYGQIYRSQHWVNTVIAKRAHAVARLPVDVWSETDGTRTKVAPSAHPYARLMAQPCAYLDNFVFIEWLASTFDIYGETYIGIQFGPDGYPESLMPLHPSRMAVKRDPKTGQHTWIFIAGNGRSSSLVEFPDGAVMPIRDFNPDGTERGLSRMEPLRSTIMSEDSSRTAAAAMAANAGRPNIALQADGVIGPEGRKRLRDSWTETHAGSSNAGKALVLEDGVKPMALQLTSVELQMIETRQLAREEVCGAYDVAPPMVHILDRATFSNISAQMRAFYRDTMAVLIERVESAIDFYIGGFWGAGMKARFAVEEVIRGDWEQRAASMQALTVIGAVTPNEAREAMGYSRHADPKADRLYANAAMQPLGEPAEQIRLTGQVQNDPDGIAVSPLSADLPVPDVAGAAKYIHALKSAAGRGQDLHAAAIRMAEQHPDQLNHILTAVQVVLGAL